MEVFTDDKFERESKPKFIVRRVHSMKEENFVAVFKDGVKHRAYFGMTEFTVNDIMQCAGVDTAIGCSMSLTQWKKAM